MKVSQAAHAALVFEQDAEPALEFGSSLSELISEKLDQLSVDGRAYRQVSDRVPSYGWLRWVGGCDGVDAVGLRAMVTGLRYMAMPKGGITAEDPGAGLSIILHQPRLEIAEASQAILSEIATLSDIEVSSFEPQKLTIMKR
jgi:hypothetical protein